MPSVLGGASFCCEEHSMDRQAFSSLFWHGELGVLAFEISAASSRLLERESERSEDEVDEDGED